MTLYRVIVKTTGSLQPGGDQNSYWNDEVVYCGYDRSEARRAYHANQPRDYWSGYGGPCRRTVGQRKESADA